MINGKGKEYDYHGKLKFEGEYLSGVRNGKGKEYDLNGNLKFEGEYLFGKKWNGKGYDGQYNIIYELIKGTGKVKEYYNNGELEFEGEYLNGKKWNGIMHVYHKHDQFKGEIKNGEINGKGKEYYNDGRLIFEGEYLNGKNGMEKDMMIIIKLYMN